MQFKKCNLKLIIIINVIGFGEEQIRVNFLSTATLCSVPHNIIILHITPGES